ncbi:MAG: proton-conducting transporter membrane subunit [Ilumatobacter sp.]|uniref:complex I subunit 5 family protein n=1 Tax=Ilumatobacter sp. TaxID=1967498 RepID=UPI00261EC3A9|nr:proton-conducting transporter membrane subunit [Ilumatobacter sp.]MDJ0769778.1 proton-conducting transporter membrane subunit [Ilumatobacter sp.]
MTRHLPVLIPLILLTATLLASLVGLVRYTWAYRLALVAVAADAGVALWGLAEVVDGGTMTYRLGGWLPPIGIEFVLDPLSAFFSAVIASVALVVMVGARSMVVEELPRKEVPFFVTALLMLAGFQGIIVTGDLFNLFVFMEIAALAGYSLVAVGEPASPLASFRYLLVGATGASLYLLGLWFVYNLTGSLNMRDVAAILPGSWDNPALAIGLSLMIVGVGVKMALFPLHGWLPDAYTQAPSATTALMAPIGTKVGAYALIRLLVFVFGGTLVTDELPVADVVMWLSAIGIIYGSVLAIAQRELKRMLAYSSVAQVGFIGLGVGLANPVALIGAVLHVVNHAVMKGALFLVAGIMRARLGHSDIGRIDAAVARRLPWTMAAFTVGALSMIGIPPTAGFFSKWYLASGAVDRGLWIMVLVIMASSLLNAVYFFRVLERAYLRRDDDEPVDAVVRHEARPAMLVPALVLAAGILVLGVFNAVLVNGVLDRIPPAGW